MQPAARDFKLAKVFIHHSLKLKPKEKLLITTSDAESFPLVKAVYIEALKAGVYPIVDTQINLIMNRSHMGGFAYQFYKLANEWQLSYVPHDIVQANINWADAHVRIVTLENTSEFKQITPEKILLRKKLAHPYLEQIVHQDRWILTYYPTLAMAQNAGVSFDWLLDFYYEACIVDYKKMQRQLSPIEKALDQGSVIRIFGKDTDLSFSIKGRLAKSSSGERNIPDGEVFLAPCHETVEGKVYFDFPSLYEGMEMSGIYLEFKKGRVVKAKAEIGNSSLQKILNTDAGARSLGELGIGSNFQIKNAMKDTLFDEKIGGTVHLALGMSYKEKRGGAPVGGNESAVHWDIVKDMRKKNSVLYVDNKPILKEGKFVI